jgi:hypothetical protein
MQNVALSRVGDWRSDFLSFLCDRLDKMEREGSMDSMDDISRSLFRNRSEIMGQAALALVEKRFAHLLDQEYSRCPHCRRRIKAGAEKVKREITTLIGPVELWRPYFYCKVCRYGFYPFDEALGLSERKIQPDVQEIEAWLASEMPYELASETVKRCTGLDLSNHHCHDVTNEMAQDLDILDVCPGKGEIHGKVEELSAGKFRRPILMIGLDGAYAPTRPEPCPRKGKRGKGDWQEVKGFRMYLLDGERICHLMSWHQIKDDKALAADLLKIKDGGLIPEDKVRICVIGDGAAWIWNRIHEIYPKAKLVLDYYHCSEYLNDLAQAQYGKCSQKGQEWFEAALARLFSNQIESVIAEIKCMKPSSDAAREQIKKTIGYLSNQKDKVDYGSLRRGGYHIGSGGIESSNKFIANVRLKRSGAWWYPTNANNILKLRCSKYNGTFDKVMEKIKSNAKRSSNQNATPKLQLVVDNS